MTGAFGYEEIQAGVRAFVDRAVCPIADDLDNAESPIPDAIIEQMGELGYLGLVFPEQYGGMALDPMALAVVTEELARGWLSVASVVTRAILSGSLLLAHGTDRQRQRWLP